MATPGITWANMILSKYVGHRKLVKLLLNKARTNNVQIGEGEFQIRFLNDQCLFRVPEGWELTMVPGGLSMNAGP
ncbi:hypothetical protein LTR37_013718 [Vermiconidia calcicola]|uniref:Uncharacterized protein n=1 Tax=Vermiconidia calcicola TaxID=1690605 RepID=A0ACC3MVK7_9PEZI|nr:hypothetical protein LTR37_013718 [Vermiconidia calcicola]